MKEDHVWLRSMPPRVQGPWRAIRAGNTSAKSRSGWLAYPVNDVGTSSRHFPHPLFSEEVVCGGMARLVDRQVAAARELDRGEQTPALIAERSGDRDAPGGQVIEQLREVVAHQVA